MQNFSFFVLFQLSFCLFCLLRVEQAQTLSVQPNHIAVWEREIQSCVSKLGSDLYHCKDSKALFELYESFLHTDYYTRSIDSCHQKQNRFLNDIHGHLLGFKISAYFKMSDKCRSQIESRINEVKV